MNVLLRRSVRWIVPLVLIGAIAAVRLRLMPAPVAIALAAAIEGTTLLLGTMQAWRAVQRMRRSRRAGGDLWDAMTDGLTVFVPRPVARLIALEPRVWVSIFVWLFRRPRADATSFPYTANSIMGIFLIAVLISAPVEFLLADVLVPWGWLRLVLTLLELYTIVWLCGYSASLAVLPHRLTADHLFLHYGLLLDVRIPLANIRAVADERRNASSGRDGYFIDAAQEELALVVGGTTNVVLTLHAPQAFSGLLRSTPPVTTIRLKVNEPARFIATAAALLVQQREHDPLPLNQTPV